MKSKDYERAALHIAGMYAIGKQDEARACFRLMILLNDNPQFDVGGFRRMCFPTVFDRSERMAA